MVSEQVTKPYKIFKVIAIISPSLVFKAAIRRIQIQIKLTLDRYNELRNNWKHFRSSFFKHVEHSLDSQESVGILLLSDSLEEDGQVVVVIQLLDFYFPVNFVLGSMLNGNGKISSVVESSEFTRWDQSSLESSSFRLLRKRFFSWLIQTCSFSSKTFTLFQNC